MAHNPVGSGASFSINLTSAQSNAILQQTDTLRIVSVGCPAHVAIGTNPTATTANYYLRSDSESAISLGKVTSQKVVGVTTGTTTIIDFPEGTGSQFNVGDSISLTVSGSQSYYNFSHKIVTSVNNSTNVGGYYSTRIIVDNDSSGIVTAFISSNDAELRRSFKVAALAPSGSGSIYIQQVQLTGNA